jgi:hypothetical protein
VPIAASSTRPKSSSTQWGSAIPRAPRWTAWRYASAALGTCSAMSFAASPWRPVNCVISLSARRPLVTTSRMSLCSSTYEARSRMPVSGPPYAVTVKPNACS